MAQTTTPVNRKQPLYAVAIPKVAGDPGHHWEADATLPHHLAEWVGGSACDPALAATNLQSLTGEEVLEALRSEEHTSELQSH